MSMGKYEIAVFGVNEASKIGACLSSIDQACQGTQSHVSVILNGTTDESVNIIKALKFSNCLVSVYSISIADKANAINQFIYGLHQDADVCFFVDAYVRIGKSSLSAMALALQKNSHAVAASGIPLTGRSATATAENTMKGGVLNGQFYALRRTFLDALISMNIKLPLQLYRGDGLIGSLAAHNLDAMGTNWDNGRIIGVRQATFEITPLSPLKPADLKRQFRREIQQARGRVENQAIKSIIYTSGYTALPANANEMIRTWIKTNTPAPKSLKDQLFLRLALANLKIPLIATNHLLPRLVFESR
jgi:glycosyltransferase involved in cell wall biosynthesis